jgi:transcriptional regulator with XRE-family HTH domain
MAKTIGEKIKLRREEFGWTQKYLAKASEMSRIYINEIETNKVKNPGVKSLHKIAYSLGLKLDELCEHLQRDRTRESKPIWKDKKHIRLYGIWGSIKQRCGNPNHRAYHRYGGRGIKICSAWKDNYSSFKEWALKNGYKTDLTIHRINNNGDYEPNNCQWISRGQNTKKSLRDKRNSQCLKM